MVLHIESWNTNTKYYESNNTAKLLVKKYRNQITPTLQFARGITMREFTCPRTRLMETWSATTTAIEWAHQSIPGTRISKPELLITV